MKFTADQFLAEANHHANELAEMLEDAAEMALLREQAKGAQGEVVAWMCETVNGYTAFSLDGKFPHNVGKVVPLYTAPRAAVPDDAEAVAACLGDDASEMLDANPEDERALNMQRAASIIDAMLSAAPSDKQLRCSGHAERAYGGEQGERHEN